MNISEITRQLFTVTAADGICLIGLVVLTRWLITTSFGTKALTYSMPRRNDMAVYTPFIPLTVWLGTFLLMTIISEKLLSELGEWQSALLGNLILCLSAAAGVIVIIYIARTHFAGGLKGLGLNPKTIFNDMLAAVVNLVCIYPVVLLMVAATIFVGRLIYGQDFGIARHQELELLAEHSELSVKILIAVTAIVVMPIFEEMLFRGLFQTMLRSFFGRPWLSIALTSALFAMVHGDIWHWPALFALSICMGYAYEKSGSLLRSIFIHAFFNAINLIAVLYQQ